MTEQKEEWLWLRGLTRETRHWGAFAEAFKAKWPAARVVCVDLPGCGVFSQKASPRTVQEIADHVAKIWEKERARQVGRRFMLGMSFGGLVALELAMRYPDFDGLALINTSLKSLSPPTRRLKPAAALKMAALLAHFNVTSREREIYNLTSNNPVARERWVKEWAQIQKSQPVKRLAALQQLWAAAHYAPPTVPIVPHRLILAARNDRLVDYRCSEDLARWLGADIRLHPSAGHDLPLDEPFWVVHALESWRDNVMRDEDKP